MSSEEEREIQKQANELVGVTSGKHSFIGKFTGPWDGGAIILRDAITHELLQKIVKIGGEPQAVLLPTPGLLPWFINATVSELEVVPDHLYRVGKQDNDTKTAITGVYLDFTEFLRNERAGGNLVQGAKPDDMAKINAAAKQSGSILPFGR